MTRPALLKELWTKIQQELGIADSGVPDDATAQAVASALGLGLEVQGPALPPVAEPVPIALPLERDAHLFFGKARQSPGESYLSWFNFPTDRMLLYTREGAAMSDHDDDGLDDHRCHHKVVSYLEAALANVYAVLGEREFFRQGWHVYGGCHNYRPKKAGSGLSMHAYGAAIDMNPVENGLYSQTTTFSMEAVEAMEAYGWLWGPRAWGMPGYEGRRGAIYVDPMHFQFAVPSLVRGSFYATHGLPASVEVWRPGSR